MCSRKSLTRHTLCVCVCVCFLSCAYLFLIEHISPVDPGHQLHIIYGVIHIPMNGTVFQPALVQTHDTEEVEDNISLFKMSKMFTVVFGVTASEIQMSTSQECAIAFASLLARRLVAVGVPIFFVVV